jgi:hypothetical protein
MIPSQAVDDYDGMKWQRPQISNALRFTHTVKLFYTHRFLGFLPAGAGRGSAPSEQARDCHACNSGVKLLRTLRKGRGDSISSQAG